MKRILIAALPLPERGHMRRNIVLLAFFSAFAAAAPAIAQESAVSLSSAVPDSARFEVVQSPLLAKMSFRLDRFTGETWQFVTKKKDGFGWQRVGKVTQGGDIQVSGKVNYQIFLSGLRAQVTVLINTNTGVSWCIEDDPKEGLFWSPIN